MYVNSGKKKVPGDSKRLIRAPHGLFPLQVLYSLPSRHNSLKFNRAIPNFSKKRQQSAFKKNVYHIMCHSKDLAFLFSLSLSFALCFLNSLELYTNLTYPSPRPVPFIDMVMLSNSSSGSPKIEPYTPHPA